MCGTYVHITRYLLGSQSNPHHFCNMLKKLIKRDVSPCPRGHGENLIKRCGFGRPGKQLPCETLVGSDPRRAAQGKCNFWELPALARILSLRGLLGRVLRVSWGPMEYVQNAVFAISKNSKLRVTYTHTYWVSTRSPARGCRRSCVTKASHTPAIVLSAVAL